MCKPASRQSRGFSGIYLNDQFHEMVKSFCYFDDTLVVVVNKQGSGVDRVSSRTLCLC